MYLYLRLILAFLLKIPMFMVHLRLPKAHILEHVKKTL